MSVEIGLCGANEIALLREFIRCHWSAEHIFVTNQTLLDWQHRAPDGRYNFVIARTSGEREPLGVLGFIPASRFDPSLAGNETVWLALWKVRADAGVAGVGLSLLRHLSALYPSASMGVAGIGDVRHAAMYRALGYSAGELRQYVMRNESLRTFTLAVFPEGFAQSNPESPGAALRLLSKHEMAAGLRLEGSESTQPVIPGKSVQYFLKRFYDHPIYSYSVFAVELAGRPAGLLATRIATHGGATALRIVDYLGDERLFAIVGGAVRTLLDDSGAEYADVWNAGFSDASFLAAGFQAVDPGGPVVVPNHFEPFVRRTARIEFAMRPSGPGKVVVFRADGDQDRPNRTGSESR